MEIVVSNVWKSYGDKEVLKNFNASFLEKKCTCIMGASGCGKTTLLNIMMGLQKADSGSIQGVPALKSAVFQENRLSENFSAHTNLRLALARSVSKEEIEKHLRLLGLAESMKGPVKELSGGMKRRVALIRAILAPSEIVFMDEPFKGLDAETKERAMDYVKKYTENKTVIMVTHDPFEAERMEGTLFLFGNK